MFSNQFLFPRGDEALIARLEGEEQEEGHHETEQTHGLGQSESQDGVGEELLLEGGVPGVADDEGSEDGSDSGSGAGDADGGGSGADELGGGVNVLLGHGGLKGAGVHRGGPGRLEKEKRKLDQPPCWRFKLKQSARRPSFSYRSRLLHCFLRLLGIAYHLP